MHKVLGRVEKRKEEKKQDHEGPAHFLKTSRVTLVLIYGPTYLG